MSKGIPKVGMLFFFGLPFGWEISRKKIIVVQNEMKRNEWKKCCRQK